MDSSQNIIYMSLGFVCTVSASLRLSLQTGLPV